VLTLTYMPADHVPVLAAELIGLLDPQPGETVVDCTFGAGGHARLVAERIAPGGELIAIDRDPAAAERYEEFRIEAPCETRFIRSDYADALAELAAEGTEPSAVYFDLGV
jgi:16S rRNA (cytosine1402-N4)-methyltransferase